MRSPSTPRRRRLKRHLVAVATVVAAASALPLVAAAPAQAASRWGCHAWVLSNGKPGGGVTGYCDYGTGNYRVVGLCINDFTNSSWWVYGNWTSSGMSTATCPWYATPGPYPYMQS